MTPLYSLLLAAGVTIAAVTAHPAHGPQRPVAPTPPVWAAQGSHWNGVPATVAGSHWNAALR